MTPEELAKKTVTHPRIIKGWLAARAAGGFVTYDPANDTYMLPEEQAFALTDEKSPAYITGFYQILVGLYKDQEKIIEAFRTEKGLGWGDHHHHPSSSIIITTSSKVQRDYSSNQTTLLTDNELDSLARLEYSLLVT